VGSSLLEHGVPPGHLLKHLGLPVQAILAPDAWVARPLFLKLINALVEMTGEPYFVLHIAERDPIEKLGVLGQSILNANSLRQALSTACAGIVLVQTGVRLGLDEHENVARLRYEFIGRTGENPETYIEAVLAFLLKILGLTGENIPVRVSFTCERPRKTGELERVFGPDLCFSAGYNGFTFNQSCLDLPFQQKISEDLFKQNGRLTLHPEEQLVQSVRQTINKLMVRQGSPTLELTARVHGLHKRTLQRRLDKWGVTFEILLDQIRRERALEAVSQGRRTMTDIAFLLGYSDPSHFIRAFRRWTGMTPKDFLSADIHPGTAMFSPEGLEEPLQHELLFIH
ncbi:MAG: AraC family transcriptional regulator, partial [Nitrospira sp.]|nr:AraC family transcriptional regulator [Nitrospira sp.]